MTKIDYDKIKELIETKKPEIDVNNEVKILRTKLVNLSKEGAILILANKHNISVKMEKPPATIKTIDSLRDGDDFVEIAGVIVNAYELKFYEVCPECAKRVKELSGAWKCEKHGVVPAPAYSYVMNVLLDDGTNTVRVTLFSKQIERLLGKNSLQINRMRENKDEKFALQHSLLGTMLAFRGKVKESEFSHRLEFTAMLVFKEPKDVEPRVEAITQLRTQRDKIPVLDEDEEELIEELDIS